MCLYACDCMLIIMQYKGFSITWSGMTPSPLGGVIKAYLPLSEEFVTSIIASEFLSIRILRHLRVGVILDTSYNLLFGVKGKGEGKHRKSTNKENVKVKTNFALVQ